MFCYKSFANTDSIKRLCFFYDLKIYASRTGNITYQKSQKWNKKLKNIIAEIDLTSGRMNFQLQKINFTLV